ncbi:MAG TPA: hypothetical protein VKA46_29670 [Gemmataceae bacterium]|nr:hypothetical protein [Gemmataceae bacterium]
MAVTKVAENAIGLTAWCGWTDSLGGQPLEDQLRAKGLPFEHVEVPHLLTIIGACWLTLYISPLSGKPVTVLTVPDNGGGDDPGETYYYFEGMTRERALKSEQWWLDNIDTMRDLLRATFRRREGPDPLDALAASAAGEPFFLSSVLTAYQDRHSLDDAGLAALLGCDVATLTHLRLRRRPGRGEPERTAEEDVADIARHFGIDPAPLARVVGEVPHE